MLQANGPLARKHFAVLSRKCFPQQYEAISFLEVRNNMAKLAFSMYNILY